ncbi:hypothetical protein P875_00138312 [Aspergillus parasiticus SU-1]|uniref:Uncharacterized protein n=1 Tax=Aspergillus parasiticus (strain ATCC 56775 / NRRL 5862 / SRRC 143 / SU-1) TaxID=1403190 RepID=A0A0F0IEG7_ASPPU|nr:hypothetical protein P875_00138312 [Aspergillus parasiticus SU-1]
MRRRAIGTAVRPINEDIGMLRGFPLLVYVRQALLQAVSSVHKSMPYPSLQTITARAIGRSQGSLPFICMSSWNCHAGHAAPYNPTFQARASQEE